MKNKVLVIGYFGYVTSQNDGQTIKTRNIYDLLKNNNENIFTIDYFDTQSFKLNKLLIFKMIWIMLFCNKIVYLPAQNNLTYIFPFIYIICKLKRIDILYFVVGGWLATYLENKKIHIFLLSKIRGIFTESEQLKSLLIKKYKFNNVTVFQNFRIHSFIPSFSQKSDDFDDFKIVFMARINRMKGIDAIFRLAEHIDNQYGKYHQIVIDFWGPIEQKDEEFFRKKVDEFTFINYKGILDPEQIYTTLNTYDLSVLPTKYITEGFPGTILDSYISGIPVIVSNWKYAPEFVEQGKTGFIFDLNKEDEFYYFVNKLYRDRKILLEMKQNAFKKSKMYSSESAWLIIQNYFIAK